MNTALNLNLNPRQLDILSKYFADLSKILVASTVIAFFVPSQEVLVTLPVFAMGSISAFACLGFSIQLAKNIS